MAIFRFPWLAVFAVNRFLHLLLAGKVLFLVSCAFNFVVINYQSG